MPFYFGTTADGSDMKEFEGFPTSPCGNYWSSEEHTPEEWEQIIKDSNRKETRRERRARERKNRHKK